MTNALERQVDVEEELARTNPEVVDSLVGDSMAGGVASGVSRVTGFVRAASIAAVLGATYFGNTFQALNSLPNLVYYQLLAGSLFVSVLVPALVGHINDGDERRARQVLTGFLGVMLVIAAGAAVLLFFGGWIVLQLMAAGVSNPAVAAAQRHVGVLLLVAFVPQVALYVIAGVGASGMNARGRFALAAGAPAVENVVIILFLVVAVVAFGGNTNILTISDSEVLLLGIGATLAVVCHAALVCWGSFRAGMPMLPHWGWRDPGVRSAIRKLGPALAYTSFAFLEVLAYLIVANRIAGGVVALQLALNFYYLPLALVGWPIARALLPQLARREAERAPGRFVGDLQRAVALASFVTIPIAVGYMTLSFPLARVVAFGKLGTNGVDMLALSIATLAPGILAETWFILGTYACYARGDMRTPLGPMALRVSVSIGLMLLVLPVHGVWFVPLLGVALSVSALVGALRLAVRVRRTLDRPETSVSELETTQPTLKNTLWRAVVASLAMIVPAWLVAALATHIWSGKFAEVVALAAAGCAGFAVFVGVQLLLRSPELGWILSTLRSRRSDVEVQFA